MGPRRDVLRARGWKVTTGRRIPLADTPRLQPHLVSTLSAIFTALPNSAGSPPSPEA